jgi:nucleotidyltransferase/DNA polymerase involved in DNA repair
MASATVLIDGNNFYASCEAVLDPSVAGRPLVVLSNNDGCIVSRSAEARALGIPMGAPYFKVRRELEHQGVIVRSSNYSLYADMSQRLMATLEGWVEALEVYSIDEAFGHLHRPRTDPGADPGTDPGADLTAWGQALREEVRRHLGLPVAVGIAPTKVLAKIANRVAKRDGVHQGVFDLGAVADPDPWLEAIAIEDVWGIGRKLSRWARLRGIADARALRDMPPGELRRRCGVVGVRLQQELRGHSCLPLVAVAPAKQETCVSRSFSTPVDSLEGLRQAIATYLSRAAEKLRRQRQRAGSHHRVRAQQPVQRHPLLQQRRHHHPGAAQQRHGGAAGRRPAPGRNAVPAPQTAAEGRCADAGPATGGAVAASPAGTAAGGRATPPRGADGHHRWPQPPLRAGHGAMGRLRPAADLGDAPFPPVAGRHHPPERYPGGAGLVVRA